MAKKSNNTPPAPETPPEPETKMYRVSSPVQCGRRYEIGEPIEMADAVANPLLACGAIAPLE